MNEKDLKEFVSLLVEAHLAENQPRLRDIFLQPAKDVVQTAGYAAERLSAGAQKLLRGIAYSLPTLIIPGLEFNYNSFAKDEQIKLDQIKKKYGDVLSANWEAIKDPDVFGFLFLAYPQSMLGYALLKKSPLAFLRILEVVTGGMDSVSKMRQSLESTSAYTARQRQNYDPAGGSWGGGAGGGSYGGSWGADYGNAGAAFESVIREDAASSPVVQQIMALMKDPTVQQAIQKSPMIADMKQAAIEVMTAPVMRFMKLQSLDQMKSVIKPEAIENAKRTISQSPEFQKLDANGKKQAEQLVINQIKQIYKNETVKWLQAQSAKKPETNPVVQAAINQIKALK